MTDCNFQLSPPLFSKQQLTVSLTHISCLATARRTHARTHTPNTCLMSCLPYDKIFIRVTLQNMSLLKTCQVSSLFKVNYLIFRKQYLCLHNVEAATSARICSGATHWSRDLLIQLTARLKSSSFKCIIAAPCTVTHNKWTHKHQCSSSWWVCPWLPTLRPRSGMDAAVWKSSGWDLESHVLVKGILIHTLHWPI